MTTPDDVTYVNIGDSIILNCEAEGTPTPEIMWFRDDKPVTPSDSVGIFNDGTELRINKIRDEDIGDYLCVARNAEGRVVHDAKVVIAGGAVIVNPPHNLTRLEGEKADFPCEAKALPGNVTVIWKRENVPIDQLSWLETRSVVRKDGTLVINPTSADDGGFFTCEVSNGIGTPQRATAYLNVECKLSIRSPFFILLRCGFLVRGVAYRKRHTFVKLLPSKGRSETSHLKI